MENKGVLTKILAVAGTVLVWFPILAPILISVIFFLQRQIFRFDYLMPAELGLFAFGGGILLLVGAIRARAYGKMIGWGLAVALLMIVGGQALAVVTGLADGSTGSGGWEWALVLGALILYGVAVIEVGVGGILLSRDVFKSQPKPVAP
jgi:hypothetical protein